MKNNKSNNNNNSIMPTNNKTFIILSRIVKTKITLPLPKYIYILH